MIERFQLRFLYVLARNYLVWRKLIFASLIGTTIEFFDFYIYATAAVLVFPALFFPASDPASARLASLATFGIAFLARPIGSALFGHFGDRIGRKTTLVLALSTMGVSTVSIVITRLGRHDKDTDAEFVFDKVANKVMLSEVWLPNEDGYLILSTPGAHEHRVVGGSNPHK